MLRGGRTRGRGRGSTSQGCGGGNTSQGRSGGSTSQGHGGESTSQTRGTEGARESGGDNSIDMETARAEQLLRATRGMNLGAPIPTNPADRIVTRIVGQCFMENTTIRTAIAIFKAFFDGPWIYYKEVPKPHWEGCWIAFLERIQPESPSLLGQMRSVWEFNMKMRYSDTMALARRESMEKAGRDFIIDCVDHPPEWIAADIWREMVRRWSCPSWQKKSEIASNNRQAPLQGCSFVNHSAGPVPLPAVKERMALQIEREPTFKQVYDRAHKRKGTDQFVDERSEKASGNYGAALSQKYGDDPSDQPIMDAELWIPASGGIRNGRILGVSEKDPAVFAKAKRIDHFVRKAYWLFEGRGFWICLCMDGDF